METFTQTLQGIYAEIPDAIAIHLLHNRLHDQPLTYRGLLQGAAGYARALHQAGVQPGDVVILILQHSDALMYAFWGTILHGAIPSIMPFLTEKLSPEHYRRSLAALFEITAPDAVITYPEFESELRQVLHPDSTGPINHSVLADARSPRVLLTSQIESIEAVDFSNLGGLQRFPEDIVLLQHSSGTTGLQKGVALSHSAVYNQLKSYAQALQLNANDVIVSWLPLYHDMGLIAGFILPILCRVPLVLMSPFDWVRAPVKLLQAISNYRGTLAWLPNFSYNFCAAKIRSRDLEDLDLSSLRAVSNCSEPVVWKSHQLFLERFRPYGLRPESLATCYAMAENVFAVTQGGIDAPLTIDHIDQRSYLSDRIARPATNAAPGIKMVSCGQPIANTQVSILDEKHRALPERHIGEIALQSNCMLTGYFHRDDLTAKTFHDGWYLTGDLGYMANGEVYVTGRKKDLIIVGGKNIYPQDLEALASDVPGVHPGRVATFGVFSEEAGTEEVVIVAEVDDNDTENYTIADDIRQRITRGSDITLRFVKLVPRGWLLKTSSGKVARSANREKYLSA